MAAEEIYVFDENCSHEHHDASGMCMSCGKWDRSSGMRGTSIKVRRAVPKSISGEIKNLPFTDEIKKLANTIFIRDLSKEDGKKSKSAIFYCLFRSHIELNQPIDPVHIGKVLGISKKKVGKAMTSYSSKNSSGKISFIHPKKFISMYGKRLDLSDETIQHMEQKFEEIINKDPDLLEKPPQTLVAGFMSYYTSTWGIEASTLPDIFGRSISTYSPIHSKIAQIDNRINEK